MYFSIKSLPLHKWVNAANRWSKIASCRINPCPKMLRKFLPCEYTSSLHKTGVETFLLKLKMHGYTRIHTHVSCFLYPHSIHDSRASEEIAFKKLVIFFRIIPNDIFSYLKRRSNHVVHGFYGPFNVHLSYYKVTMKT